MANWRSNPHPPLHSTDPVVHRQNSVIQRRVYMWHTWLSCPITFLTINKGSQHFLLPLVTSSPLNIKIYPPNIRICPFLHIRLFSTEHKDFPLVSASNPLFCSHTAILIPLLNPLRLYNKEPVWNVLYLASKTRVCSPSNGPVHTSDRKCTGHNINFQCEHKNWFSPLYLNSPSLPWDHVDIEEAEVHFKCTYILTFLYFLFIL